MQLDLRPSNSWVIKLEDVQTPELAEVFAINAMSPFILNGKLKPLMAKDSDICVCYAVRAFLHSKSHLVDRTSTL